jgi:2-polyprenyl-3-methyl-5-hydroxy-6-metoxy-1,4-benzoquinol methylase
VLQAWSPDYFRCAQCETLVFARQPEIDPALVRDDEADLYGRTYWYERKTEVRNEPVLNDRARADLPERCAYWLRALLRYRRPPAKVLELGCAHGGFVALLRAAGYDARGAELSPAVVEYARRTFGIPMYLGAVESIPEAEGPFDVIASFDVIEHMPDPVATITRCVRMLAKDGLLMVQTPFCLPEETYESLLSGGHATLRQLMPDEHLYLYSREAAGRLMERCGAPHVAWEPAIFGHYDQFFFASRTPLHPLPEEEAVREYLAGGGGRLALSLVDTLSSHERLEETIRAGQAREAEAVRIIHSIEADRARQQELLQRFERESAGSLAIRWLARLKQRVMGTRAD